MLVNADVSLEMSKNGKKSFKLVHLFLLLILFYYLKISQKETF